MMLVPEQLQKSISKLCGSSILLALPILSISAGAHQQEGRTAPYVSCEVLGQLGNQLFEIATTLAYAWDYGAIPIFPSLNQEGANRPYNRDNFFFRLDSSTPAPPWKHHFHEQYYCSAEPIPCQPDLFLEGSYLQCWQRFDHHRNKLLEVFAPSASYLEEIQIKYGDLLEHPNTVAIHVRASCKNKHETQGFTFVGMSYYQYAASFFPEDALFVIFSDRIGWCRHHFEFCKNVVFIEGNDHILDLFLMSMMKHNIIGNSTFSWWGAYLNANPSKTVIAPYPWNHPHLGLSPPNKKEYFPPDWIILPIDDDVQYPEDMSTYSSYSLSLDCKD